jgi:hypothetical protein
MRLLHTNSAAETPLKPLVFVLALLLAAMIGASATRPDRAGADDTINAVYLAGATPAIDPHQARRAGIRIVSSVADFQSTAPGVDAIILDRETLSAVSRDWLADQLRQSKLIVGLNIPIVELAAYSGYERYSAGLGNFLQDYSGQLFYSMLYQRTELSGVKRTGSGSDAIHSTAGFLGLLRLKTEGATTDYTPTRSPSEPPAPTRPRP